jgi:hypothetical protein
MIYLLFTLALASNSASEGVFINGTDHPMICLKDVSGCITATVIVSGRMCQADGVLLEDGNVFKIPNHSTYLCDSDSCYPFTITDWLVMQAGKHWKRGPEHYEEMRLYEFSDLLGGEWCL